MKYKIKITEVLEKSIPINANSFVEAMDIVKEKYKNEQNSQKYDSKRIDKRITKII